MMDPVASAYLHIPFCSHKCDFCDFAAFAGLDHLEDEYFAVLESEIRQRLARVKSPVRLRTIYFGGGTPGLVSPASIDSAIKTLTGLVEVEPHPEVTLETTPHAITRDRVSAWRASGVNRLSIGIESLLDEELQAIGRDHTVEQALAGIDLACRGDFTCLSLDFMYGLPTQTLSSWRKTLERALEIIDSNQSIKHVSAYGLSLAANSPLYSRFPRDSQAYPDESAFVDMLDLLIDSLTRSGFEHYEVSNFALPGYASRHNSTYWKNGSYLAFGVGAHRYVDGYRSANFRSLGRYMKAPTEDEVSEYIDPETRVKEALMLGLRLRRGIDLAEFEERYGIDLYNLHRERLERLEDGGFVCLEEGRLFLTRKGVCVSNSVIVEFM